ncbi:MAG TPA: hypothetical protein ENN23_06305 [Deltaproteobacteria bacterium]|nr:hypothetical protein [Deltaproteobacteria bacterium]
MAKKDDINSTEKLLNVIRGKSPPSINAQESHPKYAPKKAAKILDISAARRPSGAKRYTIGVDLGPGFIGLAKTLKSSDGRPLLLDHKIVRYGHLTAGNSAEFKSLLKSTLTSFCGSFSTCSIWTMMPAGEVNVNYLKIPRVPKKQLENVIYWTAKRETAFDEKDSIFDYELQGEVTDQGLPKYLVMVYTAPRSQVENVKKIFAEIGVPLDGITIAPFVLQNIFRSRWFLPEEETYASLFIGNDFSRIDIYKKDNLTMTRGIKTGTSSMVEAIVDFFSEKTGHTTIQTHEAKKILFSLGPDSEKLDSSDAGYGLREDEILEIIFPVWERLARQVERTLQYYTSSVGYEKVEKLYVSSSLNSYNALVIYMGDQMAIEADFFDPFGGHTYSAAESLSFSERMSLVPALGLALSDNSRTPNAIFTYAEKNREIRVARINRSIFVAFAAVLIICLAAIFYQALEAKSLGAKKVRLENSLSMHNPVLSTEMISKMAAEVKKNSVDTRQYAHRYLGVAAIGEVAAVTPGNIKIINVQITAPVNNSNAAGPGKAASRITGSMLIEGVILGERDMLESLLAQYVMKLENSPMFSDIAVQKSNFSDFRRSQVLHFTLNVRVG